MIEFHPEAVVDAGEAAAWYADRSPIASIAFVTEIDQAINDISQNPLAYPEYLRGTRRYLLKRFPYLIVYRVRDSHTQIIAFAHARRRPGFWRKRLNAD